MAFEKNADIETQLMPVEAQNYAVSDGNIPPKISRVSAVLTALGKPITRDMPSHWARFIADAMNRYWDDMHRVKEVEGKLLCSLIIQGEAKCKEDGREVRADDKGRLYIAKTLVYQRWVTFTKQKLSKSWVKRPKELPIATKVCVTCTFYVNPKKQPHSIGDYLSGMLDCLHQIGVLSGLGRSIVVSTDGSRVLTTSRDHRTEIVIKELKEE